MALFTPLAPISALAVVSAERQGIAMNQKILDLCALTAAALRGETIQELSDYGNDLFLAARANGISGLVYPAIGEPAMVMRERNRFMSDWLQYQARHIAQTEAVTELETILGKAGIDHLYLKGTILKSCYPEPYMRSMGDIDMLVRVSDMDKIRDVLLSAGYRNLENSEAHDIYGKDRNILLEVHRSIDVESNEERWRLFASPWDHVECVDGHLFAFTSEYFLLHLLRHLTKHLLSSGVGLRSVLDIGIYAEKMKEAINPDILTTMLHATNLETFFGNMLILNQRLFGLDPVPDWRLQGLEEADFIEALTAYVFASGVHGKAEGFNPQAVGMTKNTMRTGTIRKGRASYLLHVAFPARKVLLVRYPYLEKHRWLLPWAWISRIFKMMFKKTRSTVHKIRNLKVSDEAISQQTELFRKLGL